MDLLSSTASAVCPSHSPGNLRNPHIELIITSQPIPSLITHILKLVEQSILHSMQIAVAEQRPQPLKVLSFSVFVLKTYRPVPAQQLCSILSITAFYQDILQTPALTAVCEVSTHTCTHSWFVFFFLYLFIKVEWPFIVLMHIRAEVWDESWWKEDCSDYIIRGAQNNTCSLIAVLTSCQYYKMPCNVSFTLLNWLFSIVDISTLNHCADVWLPLVTNQANIV